MNAAVLYWSKTGNTLKVAYAIAAGLEMAGAEVSLLPIEDSTTVDFYGYNLICLGFPSYYWSPPTPVVDLLRRHYAQYQQNVKIGAPPLPGKHVLIFCTYSGQHTGINEAIPAGKFAGQFFEHWGIPVLDEWYVVGEYHGSIPASTQGRLGDIRGQPSEEVLQDIMQKTLQLALKLQSL